MVDVTRPEKARTLCVARLATELAGTGVKHMLFEGRTALQNRRDVATIAELRSEQRPYSHPQRAVTEAKSSR